MISQTQEKNCILLIDDDDINREVMKSIFSSHYNFEEAVNGLEGLYKVEECQEKLSAIFLDVNMPKMNGIELLSILHDRDIPSQIPVFLITSYDDNEIAREAYEFGVMDVINKPVTPFIILRRVQSVIELFQARERLNAKICVQEKKLKENVDTIDALHRNTIEAMASAIEFRDVESGEHINRIYGITKYILLHTDMGIGFSEGEIENMAIGSIMHDVGKIAISDVILNKPGKLTSEEFEIMKQHTVKGAELMEKISKTQTHISYQYAYDIARHHHERWDGKGYPDGLKGDEITIWSQVVSIADVYDALISPRVYKKAFDPDKVVQMICDGECGTFNPKLLECFLQVEPQIRKWYSQDVQKEQFQRMARSAQVEDKKLPLENVGSKKLVDVLLLTAAVKASYDMIICANLTQNSYYMIDYERFQTHCADNDGVFDDLIEAGALSVPESHREQFIQKFSRQSLVQAYNKGEKSVDLIHPQFTDDGRIKNVFTSVLFMEDPRSGDIRQITLARYLNNDSNKIK